MLANQLLHFMLKFAPRAKLKVKRILSTTADSVRETTSPDIGLTLTARPKKQIMNPIQINVLRD